MSKSKKTELKSLSARLSCYFLALSFFSLTLLQLLPSQFKSVYAADAGNFSVFVGQDGASKKAVADAWNKGGGDDYGQPGWRTINIPVKDFAGLGKTVLNFDEALTKEIACSGDLVVTSTCESREPVFTKTYYCTVSDKKLSFNKPANDTEYYEIVYAIGLKDNGNKGDDFVKRDTYKGTGGPILVKKYEANGGSFTREVVTRDLTEEKNNPDHFDDKRKGGENGRGDDDWGIDSPDAKCRPPAVLTGSMNIKNFDKLSASEKKNFEDPIAAAEAAAGGGTPDEGPDCESNSFSLAWILCPVVIGIAGANDFLLKTFIEPLLKNVPVGNSPEDSGYQAWQSFRVLGNVFLVGCLLAIVFAQVRTPK